MYVYINNAFSRIVPVVSIQKKKKNNGKFEFVIALIIIQHIRTFAGNLIWSMAVYEPFNAYIYTHTYMHIISFFVLFFPMRPEKNVFRNLLHCKPRTWCGKNTLRSCFFFFLLF